MVFSFLFQEAKVELPQMLASVFAGIMLIGAFYLAVRLVYRMTKRAEEKNGDNH